MNNKLTKLLVKIIHEEAKNETCLHIKTWRINDSFGTLKVILRRACCKATQLKARAVVIEKVYFGVQVCFTRCLAIGRTKLFVSTAACDKRSLRVSRKSRKISSCIVTNRVAQLWIALLVANCINLIQLLDNLQLSHKIKLRHRQPNNLQLFSKLSPRLQILMKN